MFDAIGRANETEFLALAALPPCPSHVRLVDDEMADDNWRGNYAAVHTGATRYALLDYEGTELRCDADVVDLVSKSGKGVRAEKRRIDNFKRIP